MRTCISLVYPTCLSTGKLFDDKEFMIDDIAYYDETDSDSDHDYFQRFNPTFKHLYR